MDTNSNCMHFVMMNLLSIFIGITGFLYYFFVKNIHYARIRKAFGDLMLDGGFRPIMLNDPIIDRLTDRIRAFDDFMLHNINIRIREAALKRIDETDIYLIYYEWEKKRTFIMTPTAEDSRETQVELHLRCGVFIPIELNITRVSVRGRLDPVEERKMKLAHGISTPPERGIPDFNRLFVCKGTEPAEVSSLITREVQEAMLNYAGKFPLNPDGFRDTIIYFNEHGMNVAIEKDLNGDHMRSLLEFALLLYGEIKKTPKPAGEDKEEKVCMTPNIRTGNPYEGSSILMKKIF